MTRNNNSPKKSDTVTNKYCILIPARNESQVIEQLLISIEKQTKKINSKEGSLGLLLNDNQLYVNLNSTLQSSDALLKDLKEHPKRYVHFSLFGRKDK